MATYSHSKVSTFENCPYQYKLKYIENLKPDFPDGIEAFMGGIVHKVLEEMYMILSRNEKPAKEALLNRYNCLWDEKYTPKILIARKGMVAQDYKVKGMRFIRNYFDKYYPFDQLEILKLETEDKILLRDGSNWHVRIDKLCKDEEDNYYICDYKTSGKMKDSIEARNDRQLAMYSIWARKNYTEAKSIKLLWHMLAFDSEVVSERTEEELERLESEVIGKISKIELAEREDNFPAQVSSLCSWCLYQNSCQEYQKAKIHWKLNQSSK